MDLLDNIRGELDKFQKQKEQQGVTEIQKREQGAAHLMSEIMLTLQSSERKQA